LKQTLLHGEENSNFFVCAFMQSFKMNINNSILATYVEGVGEDLSFIHEEHRILGVIKLQNEDQSHKTKTS